MEFTHSMWDDISPYVDFMLEIDMDDLVDCFVCGFVVTFMLLHMNTCK